MQRAVLVEAHVIAGTCLDVTKHAWNLNLATLERAIWIEIGRLLALGSPYVRRGSKRTCFQAAIGVQVQHEVFGANVLADCIIPREHARAEFSTLHALVCVVFADGMPARNAGGVARRFLFRARRERHPNNRREQRPLHADHVDTIIGDLTTLTGTWHFAQNKVNVRCAVCF